MAELSKYRVAVQARNKPAGLHLCDHSDRWSQLVRKHWRVVLHRRSGLGSRVDCSRSHSGNEEEGGSIMTCRNIPAIPLNLPSRWLILPAAKSLTVRRRPEQQGKEPTAVAVGRREASREAKPGCTPI